MSYAASVVANEFVTRAIKTGSPITQMKLQKMLYFAQGVHLVENDGEPLLKEYFQAWKYGPVIPEIYHLYKLYGSQPIADTSWVMGSNSRLISADNMDESAKQSVKVAWDSTKDISATQLSNWTHKPGSPWYLNYVEGASDTIIPNEQIQSYFEQILNQG